MDNNKKNENKKMKNQKPKKREKNVRKIDKNILLQGGRCSFHLVSRNKLLMVATEQVLIYQV